MGDVMFDNSSRTGLTLQGYDQVIALSQTNINQTLKRHFKIDETRLTNFKALIGKRADDPDASLIGKIDAPTIQLVDSDKGDQAIYTLKFLKGAQYLYWYADPDDRRAPLVKKVVSAEGWTIAFFVSFAMEKAAQLPKEVKETVMKAGSYSVDQLVIVFGTAELLTFDVKNCKFSSLESDAEALLEVKTNLGKFVEKWLTSLKTANAEQTHNILGYTVKVDVKGDPAQDKLAKKVEAEQKVATAPPTSVQFQTIANKSSATSVGTPADPYNAFLFTEMTNNRPLPNKDLQWSGNWFYGTIGGALNMSSGVFLRDFVGPLVLPLHRTCSTHAEKLAKRQTWDSEVRMERAKQTAPFISEWTHDDWKSANTTQWQLDSTAKGTHYDIPWKDSGKSFTVQTDILCRMTSWLVPKPATGIFEIRQSLSIVTKWSNHSIQYTFDATSTFNWKYTVTLAAVSSGGALTSSVAYTVDNPTIASTITERGILVRGNGSNQDEDEKVKWDNYQSILKSTIENQLTNSTNFTTTINDGLNGQKKFVFPGSGTFDMSDPIFTQAGDLLLGLVYRSGQDDS